MTPPSRWTTGDRIAGAGLLVTLLVLLAGTITWMNNIHALANTAANGLTEMVRISKEAAKESTEIQKAIASHGSRLDGHDKEFERLNRGSE